MTAMPPRMTDTHEPRPRRWSIEEYDRLGDLGFFRDQRVELIDGEILEMSPVNWPHIVAVKKLDVALTAAFAGIGWTSVQNPVIVPDGEPEPDIAVHPGRLSDYDKKPTDPPVLIVEVSHTNLKHDLKRKPPIYARADVPEYWVLDLEHRLLHVFRTPDASGAKYDLQIQLGPTDRVEPLFASSASMLVADLLP